VSNAKNPVATGHFESNRVDIAPKFKRQGRDAAHFPPSPSASVTGAITVDENGRVLPGARRFAACKRLGHRTVQPQLCA
jgi:hypothetical protein